MRIPGFLTAVQPHVPRLSSRREFLLKAGAGFGSLALSCMLQRDGLLSAAEIDNPLAPKKPPLPAKAKAVIFLFMEGGPSHLDTFDPKPVLTKMHGEKLPASYGPVVTTMGVSENKFEKHGKSGIAVADWLPNIGECVDDIAVIRSCWADGLNHVGSVCQMNTGDILAGRPAMGAWVTYGLGSANQNLPTFVILIDDKEPVGGPKNWSSGFIPAVYQGTQFRPGDQPVLYLKPPETVGDKQQRHKLDFLAQLNR